MTTPDRQRLTQTALSKELVEYPDSAVELFAKATAMLNRLPDLLDDLEHDATLSAELREALRTKVLGSLASHVGATIEAVFAIQPGLFPELLDARHERAQL